MAELERTDRELVEAAQGGDQAAFEALFIRYRERMYRLAYRIVKDRELALDVCQEAFLKAFNGIKGFRSDARFYTWLYRITHNACIDHLRAKGSRPRETGSIDEQLLNGDRLPRMNRSTEAKPVEAAIRSELEEKLEHALEQLPEAQRTVFILYNERNLQYKEIAEVVGCSIGTVMSRLFYARKKLQDLLKDFL